MALPGGYPNLLAGGDPDRAAKSYGRNAERLIKAKRHYDPDNLFRHSAASQSDKWVGVVTRARLKAEEAITTRSASG